MFSWQRFIAKGRDRGAVANSANPEAPVLSFTAVDASTAVIKLKEPTCYLLALFAPTTVGKMVIIPKETDTTFSIEKDMIGTGPYILTDHKPSIGMTFKKFPDYYEKDFAFFEQTTRLILEYAQAIAQLTARQHLCLLHRHFCARPGGHPPDQERSAGPEDLRQRTSGFRRGAHLGSATGRAVSFRDERVRQAASMSWDRDLYIDVFSTARSSVPPASSGRELPTSLSAGTGAWRLDPRARTLAPTPSTSSRHREAKLLSRRRTRTASK